MKPDIGSVDERGKRQMCAKKKAKEQFVYVDKSTAKRPFYFKGGFYCIDCGRRLLENRLEDELKDELDLELADEMEDESEFGLNTGDVKKAWPMHCESRAECVNALETSRGKVGCLLNYPIDQATAAFLRHKISLGQGNPEVLAAWQAHYEDEIKQADGVSVPRFLEQIWSLSYSWKVGEWELDVDTDWEGDDEADDSSEDESDEGLGTQLLAVVGPTVRIADVEVRIGQAKFKAALLVIWKETCAVTGLDIPMLLRASHIKPWRVSNNDERLDAYNGLLLCPNLDATFDGGLITFGDDGEIIISPHISASQLHSLNIRADARINGLHPRHLVYLQYHRSHVFLAGPCRSS